VKVPRLILYIQIKDPHIEDGSVTLQMQMY
jgi:hypothetical protein